MEFQEKPPVREKTLPVEVIFNQCLKWHDRFNRDVWPGRESYHNRFHVTAARRAADLIIESVSNSGADVLHIKQDLEKWNQEHTGAKWTLPEFRDAVKIAFAAHDLGNIAEKMTLEKGEPKLVFLKQYTAKDAEVRSEQIADGLIDNLDVPQAQKERYKELVRYLIKETKIDYGDESAMFRVLMRVSDQIGSNLLTTQENGQLGLIREIITENPGVKFENIALARFFRYPVRRCHELLPVAAARRHLIKNVWHVTEEFDKNKKPFTDVETFAARKFIRRVRIENTLERSRLRI